VYLEVVGLFINQATIKSHWSTDWTDQTISSWVDHGDKFRRHRRRWYS